MCFPVFYMIPFNDGLIATETSACVVTIASDDDYYCGNNVLVMVL